MRFLSAGLLHETNTFAAGKTPLADFVEASGGDDEFPAGKIAERFTDTATIHGGYLAAAVHAGAELVPLFHAQAQPSGVVEQAAYETMCGELLRRMEAALPADGVLLDLHGAMVTEDLEDAEGDLAARVRQLVGPAVPIVMTLDLHANVTAAMCGAVDAVIGFDTYPHCDMFERGSEAVELLVRTVRGDVRPVVGWQQLPLVTMPPRQCTLAEPMLSVMERLHALEAEPGVLSATLACGFPFADIRDAGTSVVVVADGDREWAQAQARRFGQYVFDRRRDFDCRLTTVTDAIQAAKVASGGPVVLADGSDNPGGGAPCDGTVILRELVAAHLPGAVVGILADPQTVAAAHRAGVGATIDAEIGGKTDDRHGAPVAAKAYVRLLSDGHFTYRGPMGRGVRDCLGRTAVLEVEGVEVVVAERRRQLRDLEMLRCVGIEPARRKLIAVKSAVHFRADFGPIAAEIFDADTPGIHRPDFACYNYQRLRRPVHPLDEVTSLE